MTQEFYQIDFDRKDPLAGQWEKLNFTLRRLFELIAKLQSDTGTSGVGTGAVSVDHASLINLSFVSSGHIGFAAATHGHAEADITNLVTDLADKVPIGRLINTTAPITGGGDLSINRTIGITQATSGTDGYLIAADWVAFNARMVNPMTALGDIIYGGALGVPTRLAIGGANTVLHSGTTPSYSAIVEDDISLSAVTTNNASIAKHGFLPLLSNSAVQFLNGQGNWAVPSSGGSSEGSFLYGSAVPAVVGISSRFYSDRAGTIAWCMANVVNGDGSATLTVDVKKNGTTIYTAATKPSVSAGQYIGATRVPDVTAFVAGDYFEVQILTTGNTIGQVRVYIHFS